MDGTRKKNILLIHLGTQYAKTDCRNEIYTKNWVRRTWREKVNRKVNGQQLVNGQRLTTDQRSTTEDDVSRSVDADAARADMAVHGGAWRCVRSPMVARYPRMCRSALDDLSGTFKNEIGAIFAAVMQRAVVCAV